MTKTPLLIAIVEDDRFLRASLGRLLRSYGYSVETFASAADFLASGRIEDADCLISDINMPAMTGVELHARLTASGHAIPTILITGFPDDDVRDQVLKDGVVCYLQKPFGDQDLVGCVEQATASRASDD